MTPNLSNLDLHVGFIDHDDDDTDTGLSFAIYEDGEYHDSLMLARSSFDQFLGDADSGTRISYGDVLDDSIDRIFLQQATLKGSVLELTCQSHRFILDLSKLEPNELDLIPEMLQKLNFDNCFVLHIGDKEHQVDTAKDMVVSLCWYQPEEWEKLKQCAIDTDTLDDTYKDWKKNANEMIQFVRSTGRTVCKINVTVEKLNAWCLAEGMENNSAGRSRYAAEMARKRNSK